MSKFDEYINSNPDLDRAYKMIDSKASDHCSRANYYFKHEHLLFFEKVHNYLSNPYKRGKVRNRKPEEYVLDESKRKKNWIEQINRIFDGKIKPEHAIQRHLFANKNKYVKELGELIGYEVDIPYESGVAKVDLISIKDENLYLIELKKCKFSNKSADSVEQLIRAILEIETYYSYFNEETINNIKTAIGKSFKDIKLVLLVPKNVAMDIEFIKNSFLSDFIMDKVILKTIDIKKDTDIGNVKIGDVSSKYFVIKDYSY